MALNPARIELVIGELVLHGFDPADRYPIAAALQQELERRLGDGGVPPAWEAGGEVPRLDGGQFSMAAGARASAVGAQVAQAVYYRMGGSVP
jgi:hypothetical protein